ncbi:AP-1 complex subunit beta [Trypanosoma grayi]|uniref:AP-1 complex subunit beta n=1 Tax=Trypanosoma grayi TaxID=71804 RepID=M4T4D9_9TRYP|nr:AP-1 complex subunit beta [Trypanosoma grayi]AGH62042.1 AP-1 complex subunit beta [Trypanosoma grayi]KEG14275.1 AP-1 complex subunit beta [Trypanosoma grayi]
MDTVLRKVQEKIQQNFWRSGGGSKFFGTAKRGEGVELHNDLNSNDREKQKNAVKRIIAGMTLGRDVSYLFMDVVKLGQTPNLELKKLVYLYVLNTAKLQPDKALMAVNTFLQDTTNSSPIVRALAVRTMMCIRVESVTEYTLEPLRRAVADPDPYVRKTVAIGIGKLFHQNSQIFFDQGFASELMKLLNDTYAIVAANAAAVLSEVNDYGSVPILPEADFVNRMLRHLSDCTEWGQLSILELIADTPPTSTTVAEDVIVRVLPRLSHSNASVVMGAIKLITNYACRCSADVASQCSARVNSALVTLAKGDPESQYVVCKNIHAVLVVFPNILRNNLDSFYVRFTDPPYVKLEKLHLLLKLVTPSTAQQIVKELEEYSSEVDLLFAQEVVRGIATLALKIESVAPSCVGLLLRIVGTRPELLPQVITSCKNIVRKYPEQLVLETLIVDHGADTVPEEEAKVSLIWMLGEFCDFVENGRQIITQFIDELTSHEQSVQLAILSAVIKMFLRDPAGMEQTLNVVLDTLTTNSDDPDLRDRAYAYWRLLSKGVGVAKMKQIVHGHQVPVAAESTFSDAMKLADLKKSVNTAAVVFGKPFHSFLPPYGLVNEDANEEEDEDAEENSLASQVVATTSHVPAPTPEQPATATSMSTTVAPAAAKYVDPLDNLFGDTPIAPAEPNEYQQQQGSSFGETSLFGEQKKQPATLQEPQQHQLPPLVLPAGNIGVAVHSQLVEGPALWIALVNQQTVPISQLLLQVNLNILGYLPAASLGDFMPSVPAGETRSARLPLKTSERHFDVTRQTIEVGIKGQNLPLLIFRLDVPADQLLAVSTPIEGSAFAAKWQAFDQSAEAKQLLAETGVNMLSSLDRRSVLERHRFFLLPRERESSELVSYNGIVTTTLGLHGMVEILLDKNSPAQSYLCVKSHHVSSIMPLLLKVLQGAFPMRKVSTGGTTTTSGNNDSVLDNWFA